MKIRDEKEETDEKWLSPLGLPPSFLAVLLLGPHARFRSTVAYKKNKRLLAVYLNTMQSIHKSHAIWQILSCRILHLAWRDVTWPTLYTLHCLLSQTSYNVTQCLTCIMASPTLSIRENKLKYWVVKNWQSLLYMLLSFFIRSSTLSSSSADIWPSLLISWEIW